MAVDLVDIDWESGDLVVLPQVDALAVYAQGGQIVIRQRESMRDEEAVVIFPSRFAKLVADAILREADEIRRRSTADADAVQLAEHQRSRQLDTDQ